MRKICFLSMLLFMMGTAWPQTPVNGGFEDALTGWTTSGSRQVLNARTGFYSLLSAPSGSVTNTAHTNSTSIAVAPNAYAHVIGWAVGSNSFSNASCGGTLNGVTNSANSFNIGTTLTRLVYNVQNTSGASAGFSCRVNTRSSTAGNSTQVYWDDVIMYTDGSPTADITKPTTPGFFWNDPPSATAIDFGWSNGTDAGSGIQATIILRTTNIAATTPFLNDQAVYSLYGGAGGPNIINTDWDVISLNVLANAMSYSDNTVAPATSYLYAVIHRDRAYNYSVALVSPVITTAANPPPKIALSPLTLSGFTYLQGAGPSASQSFSISATDLVHAPGNIVVTAPADYEINGGNGWSTSINIPYTSGTLLPTSVSVRLKAGLPPGLYNDEIITADGGGDSNDETVYGNVSPVGPLPVSVTAFDGFSDGRRNQLRWTTASEQNNRGFEIQHSINGFDFTAIDFVNSIAVGGTSGELLFYEFTDNAVAGDKAYYRLRQEDLNGHSKLSNIVKIQHDKSSLLSIEGLFPNPAINVVNLSFTAPRKENIIIRVINVAGKIVASKMSTVEIGNNTVPLDINKLASGIYFVELVCSNNCTTTSIKFLKQ